MLADQPFADRRAQRLPPLVDLLGRGARRRHRNRPCIGRHLHPVVGPVHRGGEFLVDLGRLRQNLLERLREYVGVVIVLWKVRSGSGAHRAACGVDDQPEIAGGVKHVPQVVFDDLDIGSRRIGGPCRRQRRVGVLEQRLAGFLECLLGLLGAGSRPVGKRRQAVGGVDGDLRPRARRVAHRAHRAGVPAQHVLDGQRHRSTGLLGPAMR